MNELFLSGTILTLVKTPTTGDTSHVVCQLRQIEARTQGRDHPILAASPETQYLKCHILQVLR